uniref:RING-type domain-containing protein n=1 Tax=Macrostomum lignano TaxID=282301 RepID=A0A1I8FN41_9PLAT
AQAPKDVGVPAQGQTVLQAYGRSTSLAGGEAEAAANDSRSSGGRSRGVPASRIARMRKCAAGKGRLPNGKLLLQLAKVVFVTAQLYGVRHREPPARLAFPWTQQRAAFRRRSTLAGLGNAGLGSRPIATHRPVCCVPHYDTVIAVLDTALRGYNQTPERSGLASNLPNQLPTASSRSPQFWRWGNNDNYITCGTVPRGVRYASVVGSTIRYLNYFGPNTMCCFADASSAACRTCIRFLVCAVCAVVPVLLPVAGWITFGPYHAKFRASSSPWQCLFALFIAECADPGQLRRLSTRRRRTRGGRRPALQLADARPSVLPWLSAGSIQTGIEPLAASFGVRSSMSTIAMERIGGGGGERDIHRGDGRGGRRRSESLALAWDARQSGQASGGFDYGQNCRLSQQQQPGSSSSKQQQAGNQSFITAAPRASCLICRAGNPLNSGIPAHAIASPDRIDEPAARSKKPSISGAAWCASQDDSILLVKRCGRCRTCRPDCCCPPPARPCRQG